MMRALRGSKPSSQKDHHLNFEVNREDLAWAAGLFEGEGWISKHTSKESYRVGIQMTDKDVIDRFADIFPFPGGRWVRHPKSTYADGRPHQTTYRWQIDRREYVQAFIAMVWPWLGNRRRSKAREAMVCLNRDTRNGVTQKLDWTQIREIRARRQEKQEDLASEFGVTRTCITQIIRGTSWQDPQYIPPTTKFARNRKLTWEQVRDIRSRYVKGDRTKVRGNSNDLAQEFGVSRSVITEIARGETWKEVGDGHDTRATLRDRTTVQDCGVHS